MSSVSVNAQISEGGQPYSFQHKEQLDPLYEINILEEVNNQEWLEKTTSGDPHKALQFAVPQAVNFNLNNSGQWEVLPNGDRLWRLQILSEGAKSLNLTFDQFHLPKDAKLFIYNPDNKEYIGAFTEKNNKKHLQLGTTPVRGDKVVVEYFEPAVASGHGLVSIRTVAHDFRGVFSMTKAFGSSGSCNNNVVCPESAGWENQIKSVCMITLADGTRWCSGSMIGNTTLDDTPYFLTADHCLTGSEATWVFYFNYECPQCSPSQDGNLSQSVSGSTVRANNAASDFALLELDNVPPASYGAWYSGWDNTGDTPTEQVGIHHPSGDVKKISWDNDPAQNSGNYWRVLDWDDGTTEGGSSGSPLYDQNQRIVGQLYGGWAACGNDEWDEYGKISTSWSGSSSSNRLEDWLDPNAAGGTATEIMDGYDPYALSINDPVELDFEFYPNPSDQNVVILTGSENYSELVLTNMLGQPVLLMPIENNQSKINVNVSSLTEGIYLLSLKTEGQIVTKKLSIYHSK